MPKRKPGVKPLTPWMFRHPLEEKQESLAEQIAYSEKVKQQILEEKKVKEPPCSSKSPS